MLIVSKLRKGICRNILAGVFRPASRPEALLFFSVCGLSFPADVSEGFFGAAEGAGGWAASPDSRNHGSVKDFNRKSSERVILLSHPALFPRSPFWKEFCQP